VRGNVNVVSGECRSHLRPFTSQCTNIAAIFREMYHEASIEFSFFFVIFPSIFKPILLYPQNTQTDHQKLENSPFRNIYSSVEDNSKISIREEDQKLHIFSHMFITTTWGGVVAKALSYYSDSPGIDSRWCHWGFFSVFPPDGSTQPLKMSNLPGISPGVKAAGAYGWRLTTLVVPNVKKIRGLNLPETPSATSACCGMTFTFTLCLSQCTVQRM